MNETIESNGKKTAAAKAPPLSIKPLNRQLLEVTIIGNAPYVQHKFSAKAKAQMIAAQEAGSQAKSKKVREPKDFNAVYEEAIHYSSEGWIGIPAPAFRNAMISACRTVGFKMTHAKLAVWVKADGVDRDDGMPLVKIVGTPEKHVAPARNDNGSIDIRARPMWREWSAVVRLEFDGDMFSAADVTNLLQRAGLQVGIGEGRPDSKMSAGLNWGTFDIQ
jgi:hypothetical protein